MLCCITVLICLLLRKINFSGVREDGADDSIEKKDGRRNGRQETTEG